MFTKSIMDSSNLVYLLCALIKKQRKNQSSLARETGISYSSLNSYLNENRDIQSSSLITLLNELGINLEEILEAKVKERHSDKIDIEVGHNVTKILLGLNPISRKTLTSTILSYAKKSHLKKTEIQALKDFESKIKTISEGNRYVN